MPDHANFLSNRRFGSLDGLRALSVLGVIWHHTAAPAFQGWPASFGAMGVPMFFAISGFLITTLLLRERERRGRIDLPAFYMRRVLRIFPLYFGVLALYVLLVALLERNTEAGQAFFRHLPYFATFTSNLFVPLEGRVIFYFSWSVATEEQFYMVWPAVLVLSAAPARALWPLGAVLAAVMLAPLLGWPGLGAIPVAILAGSALAIGLHLPGGHAVLGRLLGARASAPLLAMAVVLALISPLAGSVGTHLLMAALVASCSLREDHALAPALAWRPLAYLGAISYGLYMLHMLCKNLGLKLLAAAHLPAPPLLVFGLTTALAVVAASLSFRYYESWFLTLKHRHER